MLALSGSEGVGVGFCFLPGLDVFFLGFTVFVAVGCRVLILFVGCIVVGVDGCWKSSADISFYSVGISMVVDGSWLSGVVCRMSVIDYRYRM